MGITGGKNQQPFTPAPPRLSTLYIPTQVLADIQVVLSTLRYDLGIDISGKIFTKVIEIVQFLYSTVKIRPLLSQGGN